MPRPARCQLSVNLRYENGGIGTMTLGTGPVLEAMVFIKGTNNQAIQVLETRKLRRYRHPTWLDEGGGYADTPTEEWDLNTAYHGNWQTRLSRRDATLGKVVTRRDTTPLES